MIIDTDDICKQLCAFSPRIVGSSKAFPYNGVCLFSEASENYSSNLIYVASYSEMSANVRPSDAVCYICIDDSEVSIDDSFFADTPAIILSSNTTVQEVFNFLLQNFFEACKKEQTFRSNMLSILAAGSSITTLLQEASRHLLNPFVVFDSKFSVVAHSIPKELKLDIAQQVATNRYANVDVLQRLSDSGEINILHHSTKPQLVDLPSGYKKLAVSIFDGADCVGYVCFYNYIRSFEGNDSEMVSFIAKLVGSYFLRTQCTTSTWTPYDYVFNYLLTTNEAFNPKFISDLNVSFPSEMRLMVIISSSIIPFSEIPVKFIENAVKNMLPKSHIYFYSQGILFLCPSKSLELNGNKRLFDWLNNFLSSHHLFAGISNCFTNLSEFKKAYSQAHFAASVDYGKQPTRFFHFYVDHTVSHMLNLLSNENDLRSFYHPAFTTLIEYDKQYNTQYTECLMVYLRYNGNLSDCAEHFSIHYNSIKYRMKVIQNICKVDLHDINTYIHLHLSYMIMEFYGQNEKDRLLS